jgi:hypothetical protein
MRLPTFALFVLAAAVASSSEPADTIAPGAAVAAGAIRPEALSAQVRFLSHDLLEGRGTGARGHEVAATYVSTQLQALGLEPAGEDGSWYQMVPLRAGRVTAASLEFLPAKGKPIAFGLGEDFIALPSLASGRADITAPLVFVGFGIQAPEYGYDDFAGVDLQGKIAVVFQFAPLTERSDFFPGLNSALYADYRRKLEVFRLRGAVGVLLIRTPRADKVLPWEVVVRAQRFESMALLDQGQVQPWLTLPKAYLRGEAFQHILQIAGRAETVAELLAACESGHPHPFALGLSARLRVTSPIHALRSPNVIGRLPALSGSASAGETVVYSAHLDHLGIGEPENGDAIYNGAADNAAGVATVLEVARAFTRLPQPPKRSILFMLVTAEEKGLLGSEYFVAHPTVPLDRIVADINVDSGFPAFTLGAVQARGADHSSLLKDVQAAATALGLQLRPESEPEQNVFIRSDQYNFVRAGIPAIFAAESPDVYTAAQREEARAERKRRYHRPADEWNSKIDFGPAAALARFQFLVGLSVAQRGDGDRPRFASGDVFTTFFLRK